MAMTKEILTTLAQQHDSFYLYDQAGITECAERLKGAFPFASFLYSVKCNPHPQVLQTVFAQGFGADAASLGEVLLAAENGLTPDQIYYSAPGKTPMELAGAVDKATIIADSLHELRLLEELAARRREPLCVGIRLNPAFAFDGGAAVPSKFGIDEEQALAFLRRNDCPHLRITGIHVHLRSQVLSADAIGVYYRNMFALADRVEAALGRTLSYINLGSGIGVPYAPTDTEVDLPALANMLQGAVGQRKTRIFIETGRYCVCRNGVYVTRVLDKKESCGKIYVILKNTLNGFIRPSVARMVEKYAGAEKPAGWEPLYTGRDSFGFYPLTGETTRETVDLVGCLCTGTDVIAENIHLPRMEVGDILVMTNAGAYAAVLSPWQFASLQKPAELFLRADRTVLA